MRDALTWRTDSFAMLEVKLIDRARKGWDWQLCDQTGALMAYGRQKTRPAGHRPRTASSHPHAVAGGVQDPDGHGIAFGQRIDS